MATHFLQRLIRHAQRDASSVAALSPRGPATYRGPARVVHLVRGVSSGTRGWCLVRARRDDQAGLTTYGRSSGYCIDAIEKKPLSHYLPGTPVLSFGTAGGNLACKFCQNWDISKSREIDTLSDAASPETPVHESAVSEPHNMLPSWVLPGTMTQARRRALSMFTI